jgi:monomeric isocitrate dehydrogenase
MASALRGLREFKGFVRAITRRASSSAPKDSAVSGKILKVFSEHMDTDLNVKEAFDGVHSIVAGTDVNSLTQPEASGIIRALKKVDEVLQVIF